MKKLVLLALMALTSLGSLEASDAPPPPTFKLLQRALSTEGLAETMKAAFTQHVTARLMNHAYSPTDPNNGRSNSRVLATCCISFVPQAAIIPLYHVRSNCLGLLLEELEGKCGLNPQLFLTAARAFNNLQKIKLYGAPLVQAHIQAVTDQAATTLNEEGISFNQHGGVITPFARTPEIVQRQRVSRTPEETEEVRTTLRAETDRERKFLETGMTQEDRKHAFIQRISQLQNKYEAFMSNARTLYMTSDSAHKAQILPLLNQTQDSIETLEVLMRSTKQTMSPDPDDFNKDLESQRTQVENHERMYTEVKNSLEILRRKPSPEVL